MSGFVSGLELTILSLVLLFSWLAVAVFASAELAFAVGLGVIVIWMLFFVPSGLVKELLWQARQKKIIQQAMSEAPPYQPGSALPPPTPGNSLTVINNPSGGAIDIYRDDLPRLLPELEPRRHADAFKRSLVLPLLGSLMMIGASNETFMQKLLEARGMLRKQPIAWEQLTLPAQFENKRGEMEKAARLAQRRESGCAKILTGTIAPLVQFRPQAEQVKQIESGEYVYEFQCQPGLKDAPAHLVWVAPEEIERGSFSSLIGQFTRHPSEQRLMEACHTAANQALKPLNVAVAPNTSEAVKPEVFYGRMPYADHTRIVTIVNLMRPTGPSGLIIMNCWVNTDSQAKVRFLRAN